MATSTSKSSIKSSGASSIRSTSSGSSRAASMAELMQRSSSSFNVFKKGQEVEGTIKKLTSKEILVDIGAKSDAFVLEVDKNNMDNLLAALKVGEKVKTVILSPESEEGFPVVSLRRALDNMVYSELDTLFKEGRAIKLNVLEPTRGGYFASLQNGTKGFLPSSQTMGEDPSGKTVDAKIIELDRAKKRIIFSQKATEYITDTETLKKLLEKGKKVTATVANPASYGIFVTIPASAEASAGKPGEEGKLKNVSSQASLIEGFIHISEVSYDRVENLSSLYKKGEEIEVSVLDIDPENRRVNLSIKVLAGDKFTTLSEKYKKEDKVKGIVKRVSSRGVTLELEAGVNGFISSDKIPAGTTYKEGDTLNAEVLDIDTKRRLVVLSPVVTKTFVGYR